MPHSRMSYYVVMTDYNTKSGNNGGHFEFQDGRQVLTNIRLNYIYHNEGLKPMSNYLLTQKSKYGRKCDFRWFQ